MMSIRSIHSIQGWDQEECLELRDGDGVWKKSVDPGMGSGRVSRIVRWGWDREEYPGLYSREGSVGGGMTVDRDDD